MNERERAEIMQHLTLQMAYVWVMSTRLFGIGFIDPRK